MHTATDVGDLRVSMPEIDFEMLRRFNSPTIANAVEVLLGRRDPKLFCRGNVFCAFPELGVMAGYACTATVMSAQPRRVPRRIKVDEYWRYLQSAKGPKIIVAQDVSHPHLGAFWGDVNAHIHQALGCQGLLTDGYVRDLDEVRAMKFHFFAGGVSVSHAFAHLEDFDRPVVVHGMEVSPGDLIHADFHGAVVIPEAAIPDIVTAAEDVMRQEKVIIDLCRSSDFSVEALAALVSEHY